MLLNIQKIGKTKHKYKGKITFLNLANQATEKGVCFKIKLQRGSNQIQTVSLPSRKGAAEFKNQQYQIPMTLFFNEDESIYLPKQATLKAYQSDQSGKEIRKIGTIQLNLAQYATQGRLKMEVELEPSKKSDTPVLTLEIFMERQADDSKSIETQSNNSDIRKKVQDSENEQKKIKQKPDSKGYKTSDQSRPKNKFNGKKEYETEVSANQNSENFETKNIIPTSVRKKQDDIESSKYQYNILPSSINNKKPSSDQDWSKTTRQGKQDPKIKGKNSIIEQVQQKESPKKKIGNQKNPQLQFTEGESPQLQVFLLTGKLKQKQGDINRLKRQNQSLKMTIVKQNQQSFSNKEREKQTGIIKQVQDMKKTIISKDISIDQLTTTNKTLNSQQQQYQKTILKLRQQLSSAKEKISDMKYRQAFFMQSLFENANKEALEQACRFLSI